jgi:hypothetical protein
VYPPRILHKSPFRFQDIDLEVTDVEWRPTARYESLANAAWENRVIEEAAAGREIWNGTYYRAMNLRDLDASQVPFGLQLGTVQYRYIATFRSLNEDHTAEALEPLYHVATAALIETTDNQFIFGRRSRDGVLDLVGGGLQKDEMVVARGADLERNIRKEMHEEIGISDNHIESTRGLGLVLSSTSNVLVLGAVKLLLSSTEAQTQFLSRTDNEMSEPIFVAGTELNEFLASMTDYRALIPGLLSEALVP